MTSIFSQLGSQGHGLGVGGLVVVRAFFLACRRRFLTVSTHGLSSVCGTKQREERQRH
jgi:hypothetical protein